MKWKPLKSVDRLVVHCSATPPSMDIGADEIDRWHRKRGWLQIGYHHVIRRDGTSEFGRPRDAMGAHAKGFNETSLAICLIGGIAEEGEPEFNYTLPQLEQLRLLLDGYRMSLPDVAVVGHRDLDDGKACPCFDVGQWYFGSPAMKHRAR